MRWLVERRRDEFEDVGAKHMSIQDGCLIFQDDIFERATYVIAAGHWVTVVPEAGDA